MLTACDISSLIFQHKRVFDFYQTLYIYVSPNPDNREPISLNFWHEFERVDPNFIITNTSKILLNSQNIDENLYYD